MKVNWFCFGLALCLANSAQAQQWPGYPYPPAYYYSPQQVPTQPYYYYPQGYPVRPPAPTYPSQPRAAYSPFRTTSGPRSNANAYQPVRQPASNEPVVEQTPAGLPVYQPSQVVPAPSSGPIYEGEPGLPSDIVQPGERDPGNISRFLDYLTDGLRAGGGGPSRKETFWVSGSYVAAFLRPMNLTGPLVTTGSVLDPFPGALGSPNTAVLFGGGRVDYNLASGAALTAGMFLDHDRRLSLETTLFFVMPDRVTRSFASDGTGEPLLARPIFSTDLGREAVFFNSLPGGLDGNINVRFRSSLASAELNTRYDIFCSGRLRSDILAGARYVRLAESMQIQENIAGINGTLFPFGGVDYTSLMNNDSFTTTNQFLGAQFGGRLTYNHDWFNLSVFAKLGLGGTMQQVNIDGSTTFVGPTGSRTAAGGVLALPSNMGNHQRTVFGILPEMGFNLGVKLTEHVRLNLGYSGLLWNRVARPGLNFDRAVNTGLAPSSQNFGNGVGAVAPLFRFTDETFWAQSLQIGIEVRY